MQTAMQLRCRVHGSLLLARNIVSNRSEPASMVWGATSIYFKMQIKQALRWLQAEALAPQATQTLHRQGKLSDLIMAFEWKSREHEISFCSTPTANEINVRDGVGKIAQGRIVTVLAGAGWVLFHLITRNLISTLEGKVEKRRAMRRQSHVSNSKRVLFMASWRSSTARKLQRWCFIPTLFSGESLWRFLFFDTNYLLIW